MDSRLSIENMITIDNTGLPKKPSITQLQDKDLLMLYTRDSSINKTKYLAECGVIYYLGDPKSVVRQQGLSDAECLKAAIENYNLPNDYVLDPLVSKLIKKYYKQHITEAGVALEALQQSIHLVSKAATKINEQLSAKLSTAITIEDINSIITMMDSISKRITELPNQIKSLKVAYENLRNEEEEQLARGGKTICSSMDATEDDL